MDEVAGSASDESGEVRRAITAMALGTVLAAAVLLARAAGRRRGRSG
jgi:hypothetical protein